MSNKVFSISASSFPEFVSALETKEKEFGKPSLGILYVYSDLDIEQLNKHLTVSEIPHIGVSSGGEIFDGKFEMGTYSGMFMYLPEDSFKIFTQEVAEGEAEIDGTALGKFAKESFEKPSLYVLNGSLGSRMDAFLEKVQNETSPLVPIYGGNAFGNFEKPRFISFSTGFYSENGAATVVFDSTKVEIVGDAYSGWESIGATHTVTKSEGPLVLEIDGQPALDVLFGYFDYIKDNIKDPNEDHFLGGDHPIEVVDDNGDWFIKSSPMTLNVNKKHLTFFNAIPEGTKFRFCNTPDVEEITKNSTERFKELQKEYDDFDCLLVTSCAGRFMAFGPFYKKQQKDLYKLWKKPMAGFLSSAEIGNSKEGTRSHLRNVTCVVAGMKIK